MFTNLEKFRKISGICELVALMTIVMCHGWAYGYKAGYNDRGNEEK